MRYCWTTIHTRDIEKSLLFYEVILELEITRRFGKGLDLEVIFLADKSSGTEIELICNKNKFDNLSFSEYISLGFITKSVDETVKKLEIHGFKFDSEILSPAPHLKFFFAYDPSGVKIQIIELI